MGSGTNSVAAATAVVGYDLASGTVWQTAGNLRGLTGFAIKGSAAAVDTKVDVFIGMTKVGEAYNTGTGFPNNDDLIVFADLAIPPGEPIHVYVTDAPATNPININVTWNDY